MKDLDILREQVNSLTERLRNISNSLSNGNLDSVSKSALSNQHEDTWKERQALRNQNYGFGK